ncbi:MAG: hypothetical protein IJN61_03820 [Clostridia bacterium]|nr:hypothetical protein [Clostridia bacterium]
MSISDKLIAIAENEQKVFDAGKRALLRASKHMNATASGTVVTLNDVSPIEHDVAVRLSSDTVADFSTVTVKRYGKNLLPYPYVQKTRTYLGITYTINADGGITMNGTATGVSTHNLMGKGAGANATVLSGVFIGGGTEYCISAGAVLPTGVTLNSFFYETDGTAAGGVHISAGSSYTYFAKTAKRARIYMHLRIATGTVLDNFTIYPMIEKGASATEYEPYAETTYAPTVDGMLNVPCVSPIMTLATDTDGVAIGCSYLRDIDRYIDGLTGGVATWEAES